MIRLSLDLTSGVSLDLHTLQAAWVLARNTARATTTLPEETRRAHLAQLQEATRLARGEFLDDFPLHNAQGFDDWARFQREYWHLRMQLVFDRLSSLYEDVGEFEQAIAVIIRWLALTFSERRGLTALDAPALCDGQSCCRIASV